MPFERKAWESVGFYRGGRPTWPCPNCRAETMRIVDESFVVDETNESRDANLAWEPVDGPQEEVYRGRFSCMLRCQTEACKEPRAVVGTVSYAPAGEDEDGAPNWEQYFLPLYVCPSPAIFQIPAGTPEGVIRELRRAFRLFWCDPGAAVNGDGSVRS